MRMTLATRRIACPALRITLSTKNQTEVNPPFGGGMQGVNRPHHNLFRYSNNAAF